MRRKEKTTCYSYFAIYSEGMLRSGKGPVAAADSDFDSDYTTNLLGIEPHIKWRIGEPRSGDGDVYDFSRWAACRQDSPANNAYEQCLSIVRILKDKIPALMKIKQDYNVWFGISIVPKVYNEEAPAISFDKEIVSSTVILRIGIKGITSTAPMRGCFPACFVRSISSMDFSTSFITAVDILSGSPKKVITERL